MRRRRHGAPLGYCAQVTCPGQRLNGRPYTSPLVDADGPIRFCPHCGHPLTTACSQCGKRLRRMTRYCGTCGAALQAALLEEG